MFVAKILDAYKKKGIARKKRKNLYPKKKTLASTADWEFVKEDSYYVMMIIIGTNDNL